MKKILSVIIVMLLASFSFAQQTVIQNFEASAVDDTLVLFRAASYSGSTSANIEADPLSTSAVSDESANDILDTAVGAVGTKSVKLTWSWTDAAITAGALRLTTNAATTSPNPALDLTQGFSAYFKIADAKLFIQLMVRETGGSGPIGSNAGSANGIERTIDKIECDGANEWKYMFFDIPNETWEAFAGATADGILTGTWGALESLYITTDPTNTTKAIVAYFDDFYQGAQQNPNLPITPTPEATATPTPVITPSPTPEGMMNASGSWGLYE